MGLRGARDRSRRPGQERLVLPPLGAAPQWLRTVSGLLPLKHLNEGMLEVMVRGEVPIAALLPIAILAGFAIAVTLLAAKLSRWETT